MSDDDYGENIREWKNHLSDVSLPPEQLDEILQVLGDHHRRATLHCLVSAETDVVDYDEVCAFLEEHGPDVSKTDDHKILLHHKTLPRLKEMGFVDHDPRTQTIRYTHGELLHLIVGCFKEIEATSY